MIRFVGEFQIRAESLRWDSPVSVYCCCLHANTLRRKTTLVKSWNRHELVFYASGTNVRREGKDICPNALRSCCCLRLTGIRLCETKLRMHLQRLAAHRPEEIWCWSTGWILFFFPRSAGSIINWSFVMCVTCLASKTRVPEQFTICSSDTSCKFCWKSNFYLTDQITSYF